MRKGVYLLTLAFPLVLGSVAQADVMAIWDFGLDATRYTLDVRTEYVVGTPTLTVVGGEYDADGKNGVAYWDAEDTLHAGGQAVAWDDVSIADPGIDAEWTITLNTTGWRNIVIRWDYFSDNSGGNRGPTSLDLAYRVGGGAWIRPLNNTPIIRDDAWHPFRYDLSAIAAIEDQPLVEFRIYDLDQNDENGDFRFDNLEFSTVPEPCSTILFSLGGLVLLRMRRR